MEKKGRLFSKSLLLLFVLLATEEFFFLQHLYEIYQLIDGDLAVLSNVSTDPVLYAEWNTSFSLFPFVLTICPPLSPMMPAWRNLSTIQQKVLRSVTKHRLFQPNCSSTASHVVVGYDAISRDPLDPNFNKLLLTQLSELSQTEAWDNRTFVVFNLYAGTWPSYFEHMDFDLRQTTLVKASLSAQNSEIRNQDISFPLFLPDHLFRGRYQAISREHASEYFLTFKGKRYLSGAGVRPRSQLYHLHDDKDFVLLTTCRHGKDWRTMEDARCYMDNRNYDRYDYNDLITNATFCLVARGRRLATYRFLEVLQRGCIPVVLADQWVLPFSSVLEWDRAAIIVPEDKLMEIPEILRNISIIKTIEMREQGRFLYEAYFSSMEQIVFTTLEILHQRVIPSSLRKSSFIWNRWPGALMVYYPSYSQRLSDFPFYYQTAFSIMPPKFALLTAIIRTSVRECGLNVGFTVQHATDLLKNSLVVRKVVIDNRCRLFNGQVAKSEGPLIDAAMYLKKSRVPGLLLVNPVWLVSQNAEEVNEDKDSMQFNLKTIIENRLITAFKTNPHLISTASLKRLQFSGGVVQDSVTGLSNCSGVVLLPDFNGAVIFHRYYMYLFATTISKSVREQAARIGHCEYLLFTAVVAYTTLSSQPYVTVNNASDTARVDGLVLCSCYKLIFDQFGFMPLKTLEISL